MATNTKQQAWYSGCAEGEPRQAHSEIPDGQDPISYSLFLQFEQYEMQ